MVAVVSGSGLGLFNTSGATGNAQVGRGRDQVFVNTSTGNLVVQSVDETLATMGVDLAVVRTYNSQGLLDDDNGDNWRLGIHQRVHTWTGTLNGVGSTVRKVYGDGADVEFAYDAARGRYVSTDGSGAHDTLRYDATLQQWTWSDDSATVFETYDNTGRLQSTRDNIGNTTTYTYSGNRLIRVNDGSNQQTHLDYDAAGNLTQIRVVSNSQTQILTRYGYDTSNRLQTVTVDLSPENASISDGDIYTTTYTYEGTSRRIQSITQRDGSSVTFTYQNLNGDYRVHTYTDAEGRTTTVNYTGAVTGQTVLAPANATQLSTTAPQATTTNYPLNSGLLTTPPPAGWAGAAVRETSSTATDDPRIVFDAAGNGLLIRRTGNNIQAQRYTRANNSWGPEVTLDNRTNNTFAPSLSVDFATGNAVAAWVQSDGTANSVYAARFDVTTGNWLPATLIDIAPAGATFPANTATNTLVTAMWGTRAAIAWQHNTATTGSVYNLYVARFDGTNWLAPALVETRTQTVAQQSLAIDADGNIAVAFQQSDGTANSIYVNRFNIAAGTWTGASLRETSGTATDDPRIAFDSSGDGILIRRTGNNIQAQRYIRATNTWMPEVTLDSRTNTTFAPALAVDPSGNAVAAWVQSDGTANSVYAARFDVTTGNWLPATLIDIAPAGATFPANTATNTLVVTMRGTRAAIAWQHNQAASGSVYNIYVARFDGTNWLAPVLAENQTANAAQPAIALDAFGNVATAFQQNDAGVASVYVNRYNVGGPAYYIVGPTDTWRSIAANLYGIDSQAAGDALAGQMTGQTLSPGNALINFPSGLNMPVDYPLNTGVLTTPALGYGNATVLDSQTDLVTDSDAYGNMFVLRGYSGGMERHVQRYDARTDSWGPLIRVDSFSGYDPVSIGSPDLDVDAAGNAVVTWVQRAAVGSTTFTVYARYYDVTTGTWSAASAITSYSSQYPALAAAAITAGKAAVVFDVRGPYPGANNGDVFVARYVNGAWTAPEKVFGFQALTAWCDVSVDAAGDVQVLEHSSEGSRYQVRDAATGVWTPVETMQEGSAITSFDGQGNGVAIVLRSYFSPLVMRHYDATTNTWGEGITIPREGQEGYNNPVISADANGNAVAAWLERNYYGYPTPSRIRYVRFDRATGTWSAPQTVVDVPVSATIGQIRTAINGTSVFVRWYDGETSRDMRFIGTAGTALTDISSATYGHSWGSLDRNGNALVLSFDNVNTLSARTYYSTATPYYNVPAGATWADVAQALYGTTAVANELQAALGNPTLVSGGRLTLLPTQLNDLTTVTVPAHVVVQVGEGWANITQRVYGTADARAITRLRTLLGNPPLVAGARLNVPASLDYVPTGAPTGTVYTSVTVTDHLARTTTYTKNNLGLVTSVRQPAVNGSVAETVYGYDEDGNVTSVTEDALGTSRVTTFQYDSRGNLRLSRDSLGNTVLRTYTSANLIETETSYTVADPDGAGPLVPGGGRTTHYVYDSTNRLSYLITPEGRVTQYDYYTAQENKVATLTVHTGRVYTDTIFRHDTMGGWAGGANETNVERTKFYYDFRGNLQWEMRSGVLNSWGEPVAPRSDIYYVYDQRGLLTSTIAPRGNVAPDYGKYTTSFTYDGLGRLETTTEWIREDLIGGFPFPKTRYTVNFYDDQNRRTEVRHANGLVTTTHFNRAGERTFVQEGTPTSLAAFGTTEYNYDAGGQLRAITDSTGRRQVFYYDAAGRLAARVDGDGTLTEFIHDNRGYLVTTIAYSVRLTQSRLDSLVDGFGLVTATLDTVRDEADGVPADDRVTRNVYDAAGRLVFEIDAIGAVTRHVYDGAGQLLASVRHADRVSVARNVALTPAGFDDIGSQYYVEPQADDRPSRNFFDRDGLLVANLDGDGFLVKLRYDGGNRLISRTAFANQAAIGLRATGTLAELEANIGTDTGTGDDVEVDASEYYFYDGMGRRIGVLDAEGYFTETVYNLNSEVTQVTRWDEQNVYGPSADTFAELRALVQGSLTHSTSYEYDGAGRLIRETNFEGTVTEHAYDDADNLTQTTQAVGTPEARVLLRRYDLQGRVAQALSAEGAEALIGVTDPTAIETIWNNYGTRYTYDNVGRRVSQTARPNGVAQTTYFYYDRDGRLQFELDALGRVTEQVYDAFGDLRQKISYYRAATISSPQGGFANDTIAAALRSGANAALDSVTNFQYTARSQLRSTSTVEGSTTTTEYNTFGEVQSQLAGSGFVPTVYTYDHRGYVDQTLRNGIVFEDRKYDAFGRLCTVVDARGNTSTIEYDRLGRTIATEGADGSRRLTSYDAFSRVSSTTDAMGGVTSYSYDEANRRVTLETPEHATVTTEHTIHGQTFRVSAGGNVTEFVYDDDGRLTRKFDSVGTIDEHGYDTAGREVSVWDAAGTETRIGYDAVNRVISRTVDPTGLNLVTTFFFDPNSRVLDTTEPGGLLTRTEFDRDGRVRYVTADPNGAQRTRTEYQYDAANNVVLVIGGQLATNTELRYTRNVYDNLGRLSETIIDPSDLGGADALHLSTEFRYDNAGNLTHKIDAEDDSTWYVYDSLNRIIETIDALGGVTSVKYDAAGRVVETRRHASAVSTSGFGDIVSVRNVTPTIRDRVTRSFYDADGRERFTVATTSAELISGNIVEYGLVTQRQFNAVGLVTETRVHSLEITIPANAETDDIASLLSTQYEDRVSETMYDARGRAVFTIDAHSHVTRNWYDPSDRMIRTASYAEAPGAGVERTVAGLTAWSDSRAATPAQNALDHTKAFWYDSLGRVRFALDAAGYLKETRYLDASRQVVDYAYATAPTGMNPYSDFTTVAQRAAASVDTRYDRSTTTLRDAAGRVESVTQVIDYVNDGGAPAATVSEQYTYDGVGNKRSFRNANGDVWRYDYDANGRLSAEFSPETWVTTTALSGEQITATPEFVSIVTRITYDDLGNVATRTEGIRRTVSSGVENTVGSRTTTYEYDQLGRQFRVTHPQTMVYSAPANDEQNIGLTTQLQETSATPVSVTTYNTLGDAIANVDVNGALSRKAYDEMGRLKFEVDALGYVTEYGYDMFGNVTHLTRHAIPLSVTAIAGDDWTAAAIDVAVGDHYTDRTIVTEYDRLNQRTRVVTLDATTYTPNPGDLPGTYVHSIGQTTFQYDAFGQLTHESKLLDQESYTWATTRYHYDNDGRRRYSVNDLGYVTEDKFDAFGNITEHIEFATKLANGPASDPAGVQPAIPSGAHPEGLDRKTTFHFDSLGRLRRQEAHQVEYATGTGATTSTAFGTQQTNFEYDAVGNRTTVTDHNGAVTRTYYDVLGRMRALIQPARSADTNGDYFTEAGVLPLTEMKRNVYGDLVEETRYGSSATLNGANYTAPSGGEVLRNRMLLDTHGHVKRSQDGTLSPNGTPATKFFSYNVRGDIAKEWQIFTDAGGTQFVSSTIHKYDALGQEVMTIQPQRRNDTQPASPATWTQTADSDWMYEPGDFGGQWIYWNEVFTYWEPLPTSEDVWVYLNYTRRLAVGPGMPGTPSDPGDTHQQSMYVAGNTGTARFYWVDPRPEHPPATNGSIYSIERVRVFGRDANGNYTVLLRDSQESQSGAGPTHNTQVAYVQTRYNGFGEVTERGVNGAQVGDQEALQEYWAYDSAGRLWKTNAEGVDKVYLYDVAGRVTAEIRSQQDNFIRNLTDASGAYYDPNRLFTEIFYNSVDQVVMQRTPTFGIDERLDAAATSVSISLVNGVPFLQWAGTLDPSVKTSFRYTLGGNDWLTLEVVQLSPGVLGVDVHDLARVNVVVWQFQIVKSLSLQFAPFALSSGSFHVRLGEAVTFGIEARENPRVATPVIGPGPALGPTSFFRERQSAWYQSGDTGQWIYDNKVNASWDPNGLSGPVRVYLYYTRVLAGGAQIGDTETRSVDVNGSSGYAEFVWTDPNRYPPDNPTNGSIWSIQRIEVMGQNAQNQYTVLLRSSAGNPPPGPVRLRWAAPPAEHFANAVFYYKRSDSSTWSNGLTPTLSGGQLEVDVNALLVDDTVYDYRIDYYQQNTGIHLARKEGQIDSSGLIVDRTINGSLVADPLPPVFDSLVPLAEVNGLDLRWTDPGSAVDEVEFRWGVPGAGTYPNAITVTRSGGFSSVYVGNLTPATDYAYQVTYKIAGRTVAQQQNIFHLSALQSTSTKSAVVSTNPDSTPQPAQPVATISGSNGAQGMTWFVQNSAQYIRPNPQQPNFGLWVGPNRVQTTWASTGSTPVRVYVYYSQKDTNGTPVGGFVPAISSTLTADPPANWVLEWWTPEQASWGGIAQINGVWQISHAQVWSVDANGNPLALLRDSRNTAPPAPPTLSWAAPADTSLSAKIFYGLGLSQSMNLTPVNGVYTVNVSGWGVQTHNFEVHYYRPAPNDYPSVSVAIGQFVYDGASVTLTGPQQNIVRDPIWIAPSASGNNVTWSQTPSPANSQIYFQYFDGSWHYAPTPVTSNGTNYSVDMTFLPNGTYNNMLYRVSYYTPGGTEPYARGTGTFSVTVSTSTSTPTPVLTRDTTPSFNQKYPTQPISGVQRSGNQLTWNYPRQAGDRVFLRYQINGGSIVSLEQTGAGPAFAVAIPELATDGTKNINWWVEYVSGSPGSAHAMANGHGTLVVSSTTTYPTTTLLSANDVFPTAINIPAPYQVGGVYSNILRWDMNPEPDAIVEFRLNGVLVDTLSPNKHEIDLRGFVGSYTYELTFRRPAQLQPYARSSGPITIGRAPAFTEMPASLYQIPVQPQSTPYVKLKLDRWGNVLEQVDGAVWNALNAVTGLMERHDVARLATKYTYNVFGQRTTISDDLVPVIDTSEELAPQEIPVQYQTVTSTQYYDILGRQVAVRDENGNVNGVTLNLAGQVTGEWHADLGTKNYIYDAFGRRTQVQDEIGWRVRTNYDAASRQTAVLSEWAPELWLERNFTYDELGRRKSETSGELAMDGGAETTLYFYDLVGNLIRRRSELGNITNYAYDLMGNKTRERDAIGGTLRFEYDHFGRLLHKWDLASERTDYDYNGVGLLDSTTSTRTPTLPVQMDYEYDAAGHLTAVIDLATDRRVDYGFDTWGRLRRERTVVDGVIHQDTQTSYDNADRISKLVDLRYSTEYYYDAHGNRTLIVSKYLDHVHELHEENLWYTYDEMNRVKLSAGVREFDGPANINEPLRITSDRGTYTEYYQNGQRFFTEQYGKGVLHFENGSYSYVGGMYHEEYEYDGAGRLHAIWRNSDTGGNDRVEVRNYDGASRLIRSEQRRVNQSNTHFVYDDDGRMVQQVVRGGISDLGTKTSQTDFDIDAAGVQRGYLTTTFTNNGVTKNEYDYTNSYRLADSYLLRYQYVELTERDVNGNHPNTLYGSVERFYDVNNNVVKIQDSNAADNREFRYLVNNLQGQVMTAIEGDFANEAAVTQGMKTAVEGNANVNFAQHFFFAHGESIGSLGQLDGTQDGQPNPTPGKRAGFLNPWGLSRPSHNLNVAPITGRMVNGQLWQPPPPPTTQANFDVNFTEIGGFQASASDIVVQQGDTLRSIATRLFGDGALWYLLADENGQTEPDAALPTGSTLRVPNQVYSLANTAGIYKPFDPNSGVGDKVPSLIDPTPPLPPQPCGGHLKLILTVIAVVVTAIVAYFAGPASGPVAAFFQGVIAASVGNVVSQGVGMALGAQDGFNWKSLAFAAAAGGISGGVAQGMSGVTANMPAPVATFVNGAVSNAVTQGAAIALGLQDKFSWTQVAMAATSAVVTAQVGKWAGQVIKGDNFAADFGRQLVTGAAGAAVQAAFGGKVDKLDIAATAFGTALGNSIIRSTQGAPKLGVGTKQEEPTDTGADDELSEVIVTAQRRGGGLNANPQGGSTVGLGGDPLAEGGLLSSIVSPDELEIKIDHEELLASLGSQMPNFDESVVARSGDSISKIIGTSDPAAIGAFMRANGLTSSNIRAGEEYVIPSEGPTTQDRALGQSALNRDEAKRAERMVAQAAAEEAAIPPLLRRPDQGGAAGATVATQQSESNLVLASLIGARDSFIRGGYMDEIKAMSNNAVDRIHENRGNLDKVTRESLAASEARDRIRKAAQERLSPGGQIVSEAIESKMTPADRLAARVESAGGDKFAGAAENAAASGRSRPGVSGVNKVGKFLGPAGVIIEGVAGGIEIARAPEGKKGATTARVVGQAIGGAAGYVAGTVAVGVAATFLIAAGVTVAPVVVVIAAAAGGIYLATKASQAVGKVAEAAYNWMFGD